MDVILDFFVNNLKFIRNQQNITVKELSTLTGVAQPNISNIENGKLKLTLKHAERFAKALKVHPLELITNHYINQSKAAFEIDNEVLQIVCNAMNKYIAERNIKITNNNYILFVMFINLYKFSIKLKSKKDSADIEQSLNSDVFDMIEIMIND